MPCRVGITNDPERRKSEWEREVYGLNNWQTHGKHWSKADAQAEENQRVSSCNRGGARGTCHGAPGGGTTGPWTVYSFDYTREK